ncbi:MAG: YraN family protein [Micrococcales bacterium]
MTTNQWLGRYGEDRACEYLERLGYQVIERNYRCREGELDIVAQEGKTLVFVEVKTRSSQNSGHPFEAITNSKQARIRKLVAHWCEKYQVSQVQVRIDAIAVMLRGGRVAIEHLKQVA